MMPAALLYPLAALAEIAGCFAGLLAMIEAGFAGRAFAAYGGIYIAASLVWMWVVEEQRPDLWDVAGAGLCVLGAGLILFAPRTG